MTKPFHSKTLHHGFPDSLGLRRMLDLGVLALILGTVALPVPTAWATDVVVSTPVTATQSMDGNDSLSVTAFGSITTTDSAITATGDDNTITNSGTISAENMGIWATGDDNTITNSGTISTGVCGIFALGGNNTIINSGTINTTGYVLSIGIFNGVGNNTISNSGTINTTGDLLSIGIWASVVHETITNSGTISAKGGSLVFGIFNGVGNNTITNSGTISATGGLASIGIATGGNNTITNSGMISATGDDGYGIYTTGTDTIITNSGTISGAAGSVVFKDTGNTLSLLAGSKIVGLLEMAGAGGNTLSIGKRLNTALEYTNTHGLTVETNGMPHVVYDELGNIPVLAVVDPTLFAAEDDMVADLSRSVGNAIDARLGSAIGQSVNTIMASTSNAQATGAQWETWATGLASYREQGEEGLNDGFDTTLGGFALGSDTVLSSGTRFGGFVGASHAHLNTSAGNEQIDSASTYAGIYAGYTLPNAFVNLGLTGGYANADTIRDVLNNMVAGGIEQAKGNPDGTFLTPQATIGTQIKNASGILTPSLRIAYTHLAMDSYAETGSLANMTVAARTVSTLDLRGQVAFAIKPIVTATGQFDATMRLGADASFSNSDDIAATLLAQPITFSTTQDTNIRGFAGIDLAQKMDNGAKLNLSVEAGYGTNSALTLQGTAGLVWAF